MKITRKGRYTIEDPDGHLVLREDGSIRRANNRENCIEYIISNAKINEAPGVYTILSPNWEVDVALTDAGVTEAWTPGPPADVAPTISSTPNPTGFFVGTPDTYDMTQHVSDDGVSTVTYSLSNTLPNGLTFNPSTGILSYDGVEAATTSSHTLTATDSVGSAESSNFNIVVTQDSPDQFTFTDQTNVALSSVITSAAITVSGLTGSATITVTSGSYDVNGSGNFITTASSVQQGDTVRARHTSSASNATDTDTVITIGGISDTFTSTTLSGSTVDWNALYNNAFANNNTGTTYYVSTTGNDVSGNGTEANPYASMHKANSVMVGGDECIVKDGTYTALEMLLNENSAQSGNPTINIPDGSAGAYTIFRAENPFGVRIEMTGNSDNYGHYIQLSSSYVWVDGFIFIDSDSIFPEGVFAIEGTRNRLTRIILRRRTAGQYAENFQLNGTYNLCQDCASVGGGRYHFITGPGPETNNVFRRCVARMDFNDTNEPKAAFQLYSSAGTINNAKQNCIAVDCNETSIGNTFTYDLTFASFYVRKNGFQNTHRGCIAVGNDFGSEGTFGVFYWEKDSSGDFIATDMVLWGNNLGSSTEFPGFNEEDPAPSGNYADRFTIGQNGDSFTSQNFVAESNPPPNSYLSNTVPPNILAGNGGAEIKFAWGAFLSHHGDTGWDTITTDRLWPYPYEDEIRAVFSETSASPSGHEPTTNNATRGFCDSNVAGSLTEYLFTQGTNPWNGASTIEDFYS